MCRHAAFQWRAEPSGRGRVRTDQGRWLDFEFQTSGVDCRERNGRQAQCRSEAEERLDSSGRVAAWDGAIYPLKTERILKDVL